MNIRIQPGYQEAKKVIINYSHGFRFSIYPKQIPQTKLNALRILLNECEKEGIIELISFDLNLSGEITEEKYERI